MGTAHVPLLARANEVFAGRKARKKEAALAVRHHPPFGSSREVIEVLRHRQLDDGFRHGRAGRIQHLADYETGSWSGWRATSCDDLRGRRSTANRYDEEYEDG